MMDAVEHAGTRQMTGSADRPSSGRVRRITGLVCCIIGWMYCAACVIAGAAMPEWRIGLLLLSGTAVGIYGVGMAFSVPHSNRGVVAFALFALGWTHIAWVLLGTGVIVSVFFPVTEDRSHSLLIMAALTGLVFASALAFTMQSWRPFLWMCLATTLAGGLVVASPLQDGRVMPWVSMVSISLLHAGIIVSLQDWGRLARREVGKPAT